ncbi:MAG TPA: hypothetical protein PKN04_10815 [bacterium]|nr:hypothetical protein [bacterium]HNT66260.1 hypothetical protein [bacterium]
MDNVFSCCCLALHGFADPSKGFEKPNTMGSFFRIVAIFFFSFFCSGPFHEYPQFRSALDTFGVYPADPCSAGSKNRSFFPTFSGIVHVDCSAGHHPE